jgi:hypothetical protein
VSERTDTVEQLVDDLRPIGDDLAQTLLELAGSSESENAADRFRELARRYPPTEGVES